MQFEPIHARSRPRLLGPMGACFHEYGHKGGGMPYRCLGCHTGVRGPILTFFIYVIIHNPPTLREWLVETGAHRA